MRRLTALAGVIAILAASCSSATSAEVSDVWARTSANMQDAGAAYMAISGGSDDDALTGASVDSSIAARAELHETSMMESEEGADMMMMTPVVSIAVPAGDEVVLEPGGYHVMLFQLAEPLVAGDEFTMTLHFEKEGDRDVTVEVRDS